MSFTDMAETLDTACIAAFGVPANLYPQSTPTTAVQITGIFEKPSMLEEMMPGFTAVVRFFVKLPDITPTPRLGDIVTVGATSYDLWEIETDAVGGSTLKLRLRSNVSRKYQQAGKAKIAAV
jgi:hypothetical protein